MGKKRRHARSVERREAAAGARPPLAARIGASLGAFAARPAAPWWLGAAFGIPVAIVGLAFHEMPDFGMESDFFWEYVPLAKAYLDGRFPIGAFRGPGYPAVLALVRVVVGEYVRAGILISALSAAGVLAAMFAFIRRVATPGKALAAAALLAVNPVFIEHGWRVGTDMFFGLLVSLVLLLLFGRTSFRWGALAGAAALAGVAYLTRYNGVFVLGAVPVIALVNVWGLDWRRRLAAALAFAAVFAAVIAPWSAYCKAERGSFFYSDNYLNLGYEVYGRGRMNKEQFWRAAPGMGIRSAGDVLTRDPAAVAGRVLGNVPRHFWADLNRLVGWPAAAFTLLGLGLLLFRKPPPGEAAAYLYGAAFFAVILLTTLETRYTLFLLPLYLLLAVQAIRGEGLRLSGPAWRWAAAAALAATLAASGYQAVRANAAAIDAGPKEVLAVADWFRLNVPPADRGRRVAARKPHIAYYMGLEHATLPVAETEAELHAALKRQGIDYLYFGGSELTTRRSLMRLIDPSRPHAGFRMLVYSTDPLSVLYRVE